MRWGVAKLVGTGMALAVAFAVAACTGVAAPASGSGASGASLAGTPAASVPLTASASPYADRPDIAYAIHQRQVFGLRADEAWVRQVAADPTSVMLLDFPMTPAEAAAFEVRQGSFDEVVTAVQAYAATVTNQFGGVYIDNAAGKVVALFTVNPEQHRLAILARLGMDAPLVTRQVKYPEAELRALQDRISSDMGWLPKSAAFQSVGVDTIKNRTFVELSSKDASIPALVLAHYGVPADELAVTIDGTGAALIPAGTIDLTVKPGKGAKAPTSGFDLGFAGGGPGSCGGETGWAIPPGMTVHVPCQAGTWTVTLLDDARATVASGQVTVVGGQHAKLVLTAP